MEESGSTDVPSESTQLLESIPASPPPSYEHVLAESRLEVAENRERREGDGDDQEKDQHQYEYESEEQEEMPPTPSTPPQELMIVHKSSKELYKALAAQWGITCKMSDHCRCYDCQSHYFDCEYDRDNDHEKTDGGLGAGTPMFISEVMQGTACSIL